MSAKPYTAGHDGLVRLAARECDDVHLYVSTSDRARSGEVPILGSDMSKIWQKYIEPTLPENVEVVYGGSPIGKVWEELGQASETDDPGSSATYVLYADPDDMALNFSEQQLKKYAPNLGKHDKIERRPVKRTETVNISGTQMRHYLETSDKDKFVAGLPRNVNGNAIWNILSSTAKNPPKVKKTAKARTPKKKPVDETLLRSYVAAIIRG